MKSVQVLLGGKTYTVNEQRRKDNARWREAFQNEFVDVATAVAEAADADLSNANSLPETIRGVLGKIDGAVDALLPLLGDYSPSIQADIVRVENEAYESEVIDAFIEVLALAYPFGRAVQMLGSIGRNG